MGANASVICSTSDRPQLGDMPESCAAMVLLHLNPTEICSLALVNRAFSVASSADFIWESKLPPNYRYIIHKLVQHHLDDRISCLRKKDIFAKLSRPNPFDGGTKEIWIDKKTGGVFLSISSKALAITGIDDRRYWNHISTEESRFQTVAYLQQIWWLEVDGKLDFQFPVGKYSLFFRLQLGRVTRKLGRRVCNTENIHGWDIKPVQFKLSTQDGQHAVSRCFLGNAGSWIQYYVGDFVVADSTTTMHIKFSLKQIDCTHTKGGLCVDSVFVCPSSLGKAFRSVL